MSHGSVTATKVISDAHVDVTAHTGCYTTYNAIGA
jgi:hypothetical protein